MKFITAARAFSLFSIGLLLICVEVSLATAHADAQYQLIKSFGFPNLSSQNPNAPLIEGSDGTLYGTTYYGGTGKRGTVFKINKDGTGLKVLHHFIGTSLDGANPQAGLLLATNGWLYGTTYGGGGTIFSLREDGTGYTNLHNFGSIAGDGLGPWAGLIQGSDGLLYGTTAAGGSSIFGTVFKMNLDGSGYGILHSFTLLDGDGTNPQAGVIEGSDGALYGVTTSGGSNNVGVVFKLNRDGSGYIILHNFNTHGDGWYAQSALLEGSDGALYGTTPGGGTNDVGVVFKLNKDGSGYTNLHNFTGSLASATFPMAWPLLEDNGVLYGTTSFGGSNNVGTVFKLNLDGSAFSALWQFGISDNDGSNPAAGLVEATDGALYGTTYYGGSNNMGTVFKLQKDGSHYGILAGFSATAADASRPSGVVAFGTNGLLYGTTGGGGAFDLGTIYRVSPDGEDYAVLHSFSGTNGDGSKPQGGLALGSDGVLYGTTDVGGANNQGTIFKIKQDGSGYLVLYSFKVTNGDARNPQAGLIEGKDGALYGTTWYGGSTGNGTYSSSAKAFRLIRFCTALQVRTGQDYGHA